MNGKLKVEYILILVTLLSKGFGFSRELVFSYYYGTTNVADAFVLSLTIPTMIFGLVGMSISTGYIPIYKQADQNGGKEAAFSFSNTLITLYIMLSLLLIGIGEVFAEPLVRLFGLGFDDETARIAVSLCRYSVFSVLSIGLYHIFRGYLQIKNRFLSSASVGIPLNIIYIIAIVLSKGKDFHMLGMGTLLATASEFLFLIPFAYKAGYRYRISTNYRNTYLHSLVKVSFPLILSVSTNQLNVMISKIFTSYFSGGISALNYANRVIVLLQDVLVASLISVGYPKLADHFVKKQNKEFVQSLRDMLSDICFFLVPCTLFMVIFANPIIKIIYYRGAFDIHAVEMTSGVFACYALGIAFVGIKQVLIRAFYAMSDTKSAVINSTIGILISIAMNYPLMQVFGLRGLALSTSISAIITTLLLYRKLHKAMDFSMGTQLWLGIGKIIGLSVVSVFLAGCIYYITKSFLNYYATTILAFVVAVISYLCIGMGIKERNIVNLMCSLKCK